MNRLSKPHLKKGSILWEILFLFLMVGIIFLMVFFNDIVTYLGFKELQANLLNLNRENSRQDFISMVAKYKLQKKLYENKIDDSDLTIEELKINSLLGFNEKSFASIPGKYNKLLPFALVLVNSIRFTMGRKPFTINTKDPAKSYLDVAYYYERNKLFKKALDIYKKTMGMIKEENDRVPIIQLHHGFCSSIIGDYKNAQDIYSMVITANRNEEVTKTAKILLGYLNEIQQEIIKVMNSDENPIEKGEKLYKLMAYDKAINLLDNVEPQNQEDLEKSQYYKARSLEEKGETQNAVEIYQDIITQNPDSEYTVMSNRRILTLSTLSESNKDLKELADKNNKVIKDTEYDLYAESLTGAVIENNKRSLEDILKENNLDPDITEALLQEHNTEEKEKSGFIDDIVSSVVNEDKGYRIKNIAFYEQAIEKLEQVKRELEKKNIALEKDKKLAESRTANEKELKELNNALEREKKRTENLQNKIKELVEVNIALEDDKRIIENQLQELEEQEKKNAALEEEKQIVENRLNVMEAGTGQKIVSENGNLEIIDNKDQFGRVISKFRYGQDKEDNKYIESYSIYYYGESEELYKVIDYNGENKMTAYYLISYDELDEQVIIKKYDAHNNLMYVD